MDEEESFTTAQERTTATHGCGGQLQLKMRRGEPCARDSCPHWKTLRATGEGKRWAPKFLPREDSGKQASKVTSSTLQGTHP